MMGCNRGDVDDVPLVALNHAWGKQPGDNCHGSDVCVDHLLQLLQAALTVSVGVSFEDHLL